MNDDLTTERSVFIAYFFETVYMEIRFETKLKCPSIHHFPSFHQNKFSLSSLKLLQQYFTCLKMNSMQIIPLKLVIPTFHSICSTTKSFYLLSDANVNVTNCKKYRI